MCNRIARGYPSHAPPHHVRDQPTYLKTAACYEHRAHLNRADRRQVVLNLFSKHFADQAVQLYAWVVLPNHYHLLVEVTDFGVLSDVVRRVYGATARYWNLEDE